MTSRFPINTEHSTARKSAAGEAKDGDEVREQLIGDGGGIRPPIASSVASPWANEGQQEFLAAHGIKRTLVEHFAVGAYSYTNLDHAIAEAKRARQAKTP